ncbi:Calcium-binding protein PBP1, partial [Mucuna pruriens]
MAGIGFEDLLPVMANKLGGEGLIKELCNGFQLLMDKEKGVITLESLRENAAVLGLENMKEDELVSMMREGDLDGDGALTQMEFCVLMFRLSPQLMNDSWFWLEEALQHELHPADHNNNNNSSVYSTVNKLL